MFNFAQSRKNSGELNDAELANFSLLARNEFFPAQLSPAPEDVGADGDVPMRIVTGDSADYPTFTLTDAVAVSNNMGDVALLLMTMESGPLVFHVDLQSIPQLQGGLAMAEKFLQTRRNRVVVRAAVRVGTVSGAIAGKKK